MCRQRRSHMRRPADAAAAGSHLFFCGKPHLLKSKHWCVRWAQHTRRVVL